jgi:transposase
MSRKAPQITCNEQERKVLERLAASRTESRQLVERARIVLYCLSGKQVQEIAKECQTRANTVIKWRNRFAVSRIAGLADAPRPGAKKKYGTDFRNQVLNVLEGPPPEGQAMWDGASVAKVVQGSKHAVWRVLRKEGICLQRQRSWCVSTDKEFAAKVADIVGLYLDPPHNALVILC